MDAKPTALAAQVTLVSGVTYAPFGPLTALTFGNGRQQFRAYDQNYGIDTITESGGTGGFTADYGLDLGGNLTGLTERGSLVRAYEYDGQDRLKVMKTGVGGSTLEAFAYDATGNRLSKTVSGTTSAYSYPTTSHRLTNVAGSGARGYDGNGNSVTIATATMTYNEHNRLKTVTSGGVLQRTYAYNGKGERVMRTVHAGTEWSLQFVYDEAGHLLGEYATNGTRVAEYVWMGDTLVGVLRSHDGTTYQYVATDHLGTPRAIINPATNAVVWRADLSASPFGSAGANSDADGNGIVYSFNLRFPGQYYDGLGLFYNYFRDYDAGTGRYLQSDPIGQSGGLSTYGYVGGNPLDASDVFGLACPPALIRRSIGGVR
jgi:RHS repeat-associated protein